MNYMIDNRKMRDSKRVSCTGLAGARMCEYSEGSKHQFPGVFYILNKSTFIVHAEVKVSVPI